MPIRSLNHVTVATGDLEGTRDFYKDVLGLPAGPRPPLGFPGYWLYCGDDPVIHLVPAKSAANGGATGTGNFDHFAFAASDFKKMREHLVSRGIAFRENDVRGAGIRQLFFDRIEFPVAAGVISQKRDRTTRN
ncbi:MAG: VOC family protein [Xanthobacteraceae bacterium]